MMKFSMQRLMLAVTCVCIGFAIGEAQQRPYMGNPYGYAIAGSIKGLIQAIAIGAALGILAKKWWVAPIATIWIIATYVAICVLFDP